MADYSTPTVVQPNIPADAITMLELLVLTQMYDWECEGDGLYFFAESGRPSEIQLDVDEVRDLVVAAPDQPSHLNDLLRERLAKVSAGEPTFDLDVGDEADARIFQDILRRCADLSHISITSAWTCSRMRPDGFGGAVTVISRDRILSGSTSELEADLLDRASYGEIGCAPGYGVHSVLTLSEEVVRGMVSVITQAALDHGEQVVSVTAVDIREGCEEAIETALLADYAQNFAFSAAQAAARIAWRRAA